MTDYQTFQVHWFCIQVQVSSISFTYLAALILALVSAYFQRVLQIFLWFRTVQSGKVLGRSVVQSPAQSSVSYQVRLGHLGLCSARSWKPARMEAAKALWATRSCLTCFLVQRVWNSMQSEPPFFQLMPIVSHSSTAKNPAQSSWWASEFIAGNTNLSLYSAARLVWGFFCLFLELEILWVKVLHS